MALAEFSQREKVERAFHPKVVRIQISKRTMLNREISCNAFSVQERVVKKKIKSRLQIIRNKIQAQNVFCVIKRLFKNSKKWDLNHFYLF